MGVGLDHERVKREFEAVAYVVGRYFGLDTSNSAFYLAAWKSDDTDEIQERIQRISATAAEIIGVLARQEPLEQA